MLSSPICNRAARVLLAVAAFWVSTAQALATPEQTLMGMRDALVRNDLKSLAYQFVPPAEMAREIAQDLARKQRPLDAQWQDMRRQQFDQTFGRLIAPDAVAAIMAEVQPRLDELRVPMLAGQALYFLEAGKALATEESFSPERKAELQALLVEAQLYLARTDVLSSERFARAVQEFVVAARATGIASAEQMEQLAFDEALVRYGVFISAGKRALRHYDLDADAILRSLRFRTLLQTAETAEVEVEVSVLGVTVHAPLTLHAHPEGWFLMPPPVQPEAVDPLAVQAEVEPVAAVAAPDEAAADMSVAAE